MTYPLQTKCGRSLSKRALWFGWATAVSRERTELWFAYGPLAAVIDKSRAYIVTGCAMPVLCFVPPNLTRQVQRCIPEVLPAFHPEA